MYLQACERGTKANLTQNFDTDTWAYKDSLTLKYNNSTANSACALKLGLTFSQDYPYRNIYIRFTMKAPNGVMQTSVSEFLLSEPDGTWHVEPDWRENYHFETILNPRTTLPQIGDYEFKLVQYMRDDVLKGVKAVRFSVIEPEKE